jgi:hypothetical protein
MAQCCDNCKIYDAHGSQHPPFHNITIGSCVDSTVAIKAIGSAPGSDTITVDVDSLTNSTIGSLRTPNGHFVLGSMVNSSVVDGFHSTWVEIHGSHVVVDSMLDSRVSSNCEDLYIEAMIRSYAAIGPKASILGVVVDSDIVANGEVIIPYIENSRIRCQYCRPEGVQAPVILDSSISGDGSLHVEDKIVNSQVDTDAPFSDEGFTVIKSIVNSKFKTPENYVGADLRGTTIEDSTVTFKAVSDATDGGSRVLRIRDAIIRNSTIELLYGKFSVPDGQLQIIDSKFFPEAYMDIKKSFKLCNATYEYSHDYHADHIEGFRYTEIFALSDSYYKGNFAYKNTIVNDSRVECRVWNATNITIIGLRHANPDVLLRLTWYGNPPGMGDDPASSRFECISIVDCWIGDSAVEAVDFRYLDANNPSFVVSGIDLATLGVIEDNVLTITLSSDSDEHLEDILHVDVNELDLPTCGGVLKEGTTMLADKLIKTENYSKFFGVGTGKIVIQNLAERLFVDTEEGEKGCG